MSVIDLYKTVEKEVLGRPVLFTLDARDTQDGQFSCRCRGPSGTPTNIIFHDNHNGTYDVNLNAVESGIHSVEINNNGVPIKGSPFVVNIPQHTEKKQLIRVYGPGLKSGLLATFRAEFQVDTSHAGVGDLKVRIHGPTDSFHVQMEPSQMNPRLINVRYNPTLPGVYMVHVLWGTVHVAGSPFKVLISDKVSTTTNKPAPQRRSVSTDGKPRSSAKSSDKSSVPSTQQSQYADSKRSKSSNKSSVLAAQQSQFTDSKRTSTSAQSSQYPSQSTATDSRRTSSKYSAPSTAQSKDPEFGQSQDPEFGQSANVSDKKKQKKKKGKAK